MSSPRSQRLRVVRTLVDGPVARERPLRCLAVSEASTHTGTALLDELETHRKELTGYCYRMLGSGFEAEDAVQETMVRAWKNIDGFEGRSSLRSWLYRIATNVCLDMAQGPQRRARPMDLGPASSASTPLSPGIAEHNWVMPIHDAKVLPEDGDPADVAAARESIRLAFVAALQHLPAKQRAVLILREVLRWQATEVAELLDTSVASVNSALQRARATLDDVHASDITPLQVDDEQRALLDRYVDAFERYDISSLVSLLHDDATFTMPPFELWLQGVDDIAQWYVGQGAACEGSRLVATSANGCPAFASYKPAGPGAWEPFNLHLVEISGGRIAGLHHFLYPELYPLFGLPPRLER
jgi:RNA polymerase sigma-70 factor, ECF subfamily